MIKALASALLLLITANVYSNSSDTIDLDQVTRLLNQQSSNPIFNNQANELKEQQTNTQCILTGKVIRVVDGDTVYVLDEKKKQHNIRLAGIDAPERGQPYGKAATKYLKELITGKNVCVDWYKKDRYKRLVGVIHYKNQDINYQMVQKGYAWHFKKYQKEQTPKDRILYAKAETNSRLNVTGLWQEPDPINPDDWRDGVRPTKQKANQPKNVTNDRPLQNSPAETTGFTCSAKRFCKHMTSCAEACHYLTQCGLSRLDRDKDGIPCESICRQSC